MRLPQSVARLIEEFQKLPGIGPRSAQRLTYFLLRAPQVESDALSQAIYNLKRQTTICETCFNIAETNPCDICADERRDPAKICVVEEPLDVLAIEKTGKFNGIYHVLGGSLNPVAGVGPEELRIEELLTRLRRAETGERRNEAFVLELILATNPDLEGEATAMFIRKKLKAQSVKFRSVAIKITRIARGLPTGGDLEYADEVTIARAFEGRSEY